MKRIHVDPVNNQVVMPLHNGKPRIICICNGEAGLLELPDHCEVTLKVHDGKFHFTNVNEKILFESIKIK